jgi:hypothetical protein
VDGNHRVSALMLMTPAEQRLVLDGTTVKCVVYEGVPAKLIAILTLHVNDEGLKRSATTNWHKLRFGFKAYLYLAGMEVEKVTVGLLTKAVTWSDSSSSTTLTQHDISLIFRLGDRFGTAGLSIFMETFTAIEDDYPPAVRKTICDVVDTFTTPALHWKIPDKDHKLKSVLDNEAVERRTDQDEFLPTNNKLYQRIFKLNSKEVVTLQTQKQPTCWRKIASRFSTCSSTTSSTAPGSPPEKSLKKPPSGRS